MLLVVGHDHGRAEYERALRRAFSVVRVSSLEAARDRCRHEAWDAVVIDRSLADPAVAWFVWDLRRGGITPERIPVLAVLDGPNAEVEVDGTVSPSADGGGIRTAVRRAIRVAEYDDAVDRLFDVCRWTICRRSSDVGAARKRADECLRALDACDGRLPFERLVDA